MQNNHRTMRQRESQHHNHRYYSSFFLGVFVVIISIVNVAQYHQILPNIPSPSNTTVVNENGSLSHSPTSTSLNNACDRARDINPDAILANVTIDMKDIDPNNSKLNEESIKFSILVFSERVDKYISRGILNGKVHERDLSTFIAKALPLDAGNNNTINDDVWAVDIGANVGYHSLHMVRRGASVISFEPAPDTRALLECSATMLVTSSTQKGRSSQYHDVRRGSIQIIPAGASNERSEGFMTRHPDSPGMTTFRTNLDNSFPFEKVNFSNDEGSEKNGGSIQLVRVQDILEAKGVPEGRSPKLRLLKLDAEGFELKALQGLNLTRYPFQYFTYEFFPSLLREKNGSEAGTTDEPLELLRMVREAGYICDKDDVIGSTKEEMQTWIDGIKESQHVNMFCQLE